MSETLAGAAPVGEEWKAMSGGDDSIDSYESDQAYRRSKDGVDRYRKLDWIVRTVDSNGTPLRGVPVKVNQLEHAFAFGEGLWGLDEAARYGEWDHDRTISYRHLLREALNSVNALSYWTEAPRNDASKAMERQGEERLENFAKCVDWALSQGMQVKGHTLLWSIDKCWPSWLAKYDIDTQMRFAEVRVRNLVARFSGRISTWDVVNEAMWEPCPKNLPHRRWPHLEAIRDIADYVAPTFRWAREEDPQATLVLNDYGLEHEPENPPTSLDGRQATAAYQRSRLKELVAELLDRGTPVDALGLQSHTGSWQSAAAQAEVYDEIASYGLPLQVTEFWARQRGAPSHIAELPTLEFEERQADFVERYLTVAFGHPAMGAFYFWGFMGMGVEWKARSCHRTTAVFHRVRELLQQRWRTNESVVTDSEGCIFLRAFPGTYSLDVNGRAETLSLAGGSSRAQTNEIVVAKVR